MLYCKIMCIMCLRYKQLNYLKNNLYSSFILPYKGRSDLTSQHF